MTRQDQPNVVVLCTDQHRYDALGCYGNSLIATPAIDRLAGDGVLFERCYTPSPVCGPARASMLTGLFPHAHGLWANGVALPPRQILLGRLLADAGYDCGLVGKLHLSSAKGGRTERRYDDGFRVFKWSSGPAHTSPANSYHQWLESTFPELWSRQRVGQPRTDAGGRHTLRPGEDMPTEAHYSRWVAQEAIDYIRRGRDESKPFFLLANFFDPHHPFVAPDEYMAKYRDVAFPPPIRAPRPADGKPPIQAELSSGRVGPGPGFSGYESALHDVIATYYAMIDLVDDEIGRIVSALDGAGLRDNTLVILTSDHGEMLGDHAQILKGPLFYEGAVRVPLVMRWPDRVQAGQRRNDLVQSLDVFATALAAAGCPVPETSQSIDLLRPDAARALEQDRPWALCEYRNSGFPIEPAVHATMLRKGRYKVVVHHSGVRQRAGELYDLDDDPSETVNRWDCEGFGAVRREMTESLLDALVGTEDRSAVREAAW
jgi:arylsulfatase